MAAGTSGTAGASEAGREGREGPRGGKKPLRPQQQQVQALQAELERKSEEMRKAQEQRELLQQRIKVLEAVLPVRDQQLHWLTQRKQQQQQHATRPAQLTAPPSGALALHDAWTPPGSHGSGSAAASGSAASTSCSDAQSLGCDAGGGCGPAGGCGGLGVPPPGSSCTPGAVLEHFRVMWNSWVREAGLLLHLHDARPHDPGPELRAGRLREGLMSSLRPLRLEHSRLMLDILDVNMETGARGEAPADSSAARREGTGCARGGSYVAVRSFSTRLRGGGAGGGGAGSSNSARAAAILGGSARGTPGSDFLGSTLFNLMQSIRVAVLSYPYFPDAIAVLNAVAAMPTASVTASDTQR
ncbi:hypothetical protein TSOC_005140 [Tetrabaena socialis]|uniref:Uncharacterized protein n=1 Tax=Tetrabaena socialis TaxID=47790 RepID=A0A2J8A704_9CHLO|nr:hypothetical protein TSOC_005140 [Tetrabaena socialis]|eukprot:PNH08304.1 hypothetical protein TSOC_005140 [Tetrabaena socialis]